MAPESSLAAWSDIILRREYPVTHTVTRLRQPLDIVEWVDPKTLRANDYNPNHVFGPEMALLALSILEDGWTQPIVAREDNEIVDGFHRWTIAMHNAMVLALTDGLVPVVRLRNKSRADQMLATVRHNRARGQHGITSMGAIVNDLRTEGLSDLEIQTRLGMELEEVELLGETRGSPKVAGQEDFGQGWVPMAEAEANVTPASKPARKKTSKKVPAGDPPAQ